jgi:hypothetical protein
MTQTTDSLPLIASRRNQHTGILEFFVPQINEYAIAMVPVQTRGGLITRLVQTQFDELKELLTGLEALGDLPTAINQYKSILDTLEELSAAAGRNLDLITPDIEVVRQTIESIDTIRLANVLNAITLSRADTVAAIATNRSDIVAAVNASITAITNAITLSRADTVAAIATSETDIVAAVNASTTAITNAITLSRADTVAAIATSEANIVGAVNASNTAITNAINLLSGRVDVAIARIEAVTRTIGATRANTLDQTSVPMTNANQEYSYVIPNNTKILVFRCEPVAGATADDPPVAVDTFYSLQIGQVTLGTTGQLATGGARPKCRKLLALNEFNGNQLDLVGKTLYFACSQAGWVMSIDAWSRIN